MIFVFFFCQASVVRRHHDPPACTPIMMTLWGGVQWVIL